MKALPTYPGAVGERHDSSSLAVSCRLEDAELYVAVLVQGNRGTFEVVHAEGVQDEGAGADMRVVYELDGALLNGVEDAEFETEPEHSLQRLPPMHLALERDVAGEVLSVH